MNDQNLIPLNRRSKKAQREIQEKGRQANAKKWKQKLALRELLTKGDMADIVQEKIFNIEGVDEVTGEVVTAFHKMLDKHIQKAMKGSLASFEVLVKLAGLTEDKTQVNTQININTQQTAEDRYNEVYGRIEEAELLKPTDDNR